MKKEIIKNISTKLLTAIQMPNSLIAEQSILGTMILENKCIDDFLSDSRIRKLESKPEKVFYSPANQTILKTILLVFEKKKTIDLTILAESLKTNNLLDEVGGIDYIISLEQYVVATDNFICYLDIVFEKATQRAAIKYCIDIIEKLSEIDGSSGEHTEEIKSHIRKLTDLLKATSRDIDKDLDSQFYELIESLSYDQQNLLKNVCYPTFSYLLNNKLGGGIRNYFYVIEAKRQAGKTTLLGNIVLSAAYYQKMNKLDVVNVMYVRENTFHNTLQDLIACSMDFPRAILRIGNLKEQDIQALISIWQERYLENRIIIRDNFSHIEDIELDLRQIAKKQKIGIVTMDFLSRFSFKDFSKLPRGGNITFYTQLLIQKIKDIQMQYKCPLILAAQKTDESEQTSQKQIQRNKTNVSSHARGYRGLIDDSDVYFYMENLSNENVTEAGNLPTHDIDLIIKKNKSADGWTGLIPMMVERQFARLKERRK